MDNCESKLEAMQLQEDKAKKQLKLLETEKEELRDIVKQMERKLVAVKLEVASNRADKMQQDVALLQNHIAQVP